MKYKRFTPYRNDLTIRCYDTNIYKNHYCEKILCYKNDYFEHYKNNCQIIRYKNESINGAWIHGKWHYYEPNGDLFVK